MLWRPRPFDTTAIGAKSRGTLSPQHILSHRTLRYSWYRYPHGGQLIQLVVKLPKLHQVGMQRVDKSHSQKIFQDLCFSVCSATKINSEWNCNLGIWDISDENCSDKVRISRLKRDFFASSFIKNSQQKRKSMQG